MKTPQAEIVIFQTEDGNKRLIGADGKPIINDIGLAALTFLVAESAPKNKEIIIKLLANMLALKQK